MAHNSKDLEDNCLLKNLKNRYTDIENKKEKGTPKEDVKQDKNQSGTWYNLKKEAKSP